MEITKREALALIKILDRTGLTDGYDPNSLHSLNVRLEAFVLGEGVDNDEVYETRYGQVVSAIDEAPPSDDALSYEGEMGGAMSTDLLRDLKPIKGKVVSSSVADPDTKVELEFYVQSGLIDLWVDKGDSVIGPLESIKRGPASISVSEKTVDEDGLTWHEFYVAKFPKDWVNAIPVDEVLTIEKGEADED